MTARLPDWERRLNAFLAQPFVFEWGAMDCALFACAAVEALTGAHPYPEFLGVYSDRIGAARALRELGKGTLEATFGQKFAEVPPGFARRGDVVMATDGAMGVCVGASAVFLAEEGGLIRLPRATFTHAWRIG
jgi:hypothetical protein